MSSGAINWVLKLSELKAGPWRTLMLLANSANEETRSSWLSMQTLVRKTGSSKSVVLDHIKELHLSGYIVPGDQRYVAHIAANKRPKVWLLNLERGTSLDARRQLPLPDGRGTDSVPQTGVRNPDPNDSRGPETTALGVRNPDPNQELNQEHPTRDSAQGDHLARAREPLDPDRARELREQCRTTVRQAIDQQKASQTNAKVPAADRK